MKVQFSKHGEPYEFRYFGDIHQLVFQTFEHDSDSLVRMKKQLGQTKGGVDIVVDENSESIFKSLAIFYHPCFEPKISNEYTILICKQKLKNSVVPVVFDQNVARDLLYFVGLWRSVLYSPVNSKGYFWHNFKNTSRMYAVTRKKQTAFLGSKIDFDPTKGFLS